MHCTQWSRELARVGCDNSDVIVAATTMAAAVWRSIAQMKNAKGTIVAERLYM